MTGSPLPLTDSHCHLDDDRFDDDRDAVVQRATAAGVQRIITPAIGRREWPRLKRIATRYEQVFPAYGLHPMFIDRHTTTDIDALTSWVAAEKPIAIGECGLDFHHDRDSRQHQIELFDAQLALAQRYGLPLIVHARKAVEEAIGRIRRYAGVRGVFHSYSGSYEQAKRLLDLGFMFGIGGPFTWTRSRKLRDLLPRLPLESLLLETDAPDQPDEQHRGQRNEPAFITDIAASIAQQLDIDLETLAETTTTNAITLFFQR